MSYGYARMAYGFGSAEVGGGTITGGGTPPRIPVWVTATSLGNGSWEFSGNAIRPVSTLDDSDIGDTTHRVRALYMASTIDYDSGGSGLDIASGGTTRVSISTGGNMSVGAAGAVTSRLNVTAGGNIGLTYAISAYNDIGSELFFVKDNGRVSVGTSSSNGIFDVKDDSELGQFLTSTGVSRFNFKRTTADGISAGSLRYLSSDGTVKWSISTSLVQGSDNLEFNAGALGNRMIIERTTGNIGIGTNTPNASSILDITSTTAGILIPRMTTTQRDAITVGASTTSLLVFNTSTNKFNFWNNSLGMWEVIDTSTGGDVSGSGTTNFITKWTDGANSTIGNSIVFDDGTNVGIGTITPSEKLQVAGLIVPDADDTYDLGKLALRWRDLYLGSKIDFSSNLEFVKGGVTYAEITSTGDFTVGAAGVVTSKINSTTSGNLGLTYAFSSYNDIGAELFFVRDNGKVGIGTSTPTSELQVVGTIRATDFFATNKIDTSTRTLKTSLTFTRFNWESGIGFDATGVGSISFDRILYASPSINWVARGSTNDGSTYSFIIEDSGSIGLVYFLTDGSVGIGTASPLSFVQITKNQNATTSFAVENKNVTSNASTNFTLSSDATSFTIDTYSSVYADASLANKARLSGNFLILNSNNDITFTSGVTTLVKFTTSESDFIFSGGSAVARINSSGNLIIGGTTAALSATQTIHVYSGVAPAGNITDGFTLYSSDITAGNAVPSFRTENGQIIKLYRDTGWSAITGTALKGGWNTTSGSLLQAKQTIKALVDYFMANGQLGT